MNKAIVERFAAFAGEIVEIPWKNPNRIFLNGYARAKVKFPVKRPVFTGKFIPFNGKKEWVYLKFEDLQLICYLCGKWGHDQRDCKGDVVMVGDRFGAKVRLYRPWLRNENSSKHCFEGLNYGKRPNQRILKAEEKKDERKV